jgi:hypothetical protein
MTPSSPRLLLGCIADDFTGATDLANNLVRVACGWCRPSACRTARWTPVPTPWWSR